MSEVIERGTTRIGLRIGRSQNERLLTELLAGLEIVPITDTVPADTDLCIVDNRELSDVDSALEDWKRTQQPVFAPVLLLSESGGTNPWRQYAELLGNSIDAIQPIPSPSQAIRARVDSLLATHHFSHELNNERQLVERIFGTSPIAKTVLDTDGTIIRANDRAEDVLGLSESDLSERTYDSPQWQILDENDEPIPSDELPFSLVMESGEPIYGYEHDIIKPDGERVCLSINMGPVLDETGEIEYLVSSIEDVTERKRLERELRESEELHRATLSNITDTVFITNDEGEFTYVCPNVHFIFGHSESDVRARDTVDSLLGGDPAPSGFGEGDTVENIDWEVTDADGTKHTVLVTVKSVSIQNGTRLYSVRDVTELVESERQLELERQRLESVVSNAPLILIAIDTDGEITLARGRQLELIGLDSSELTGRSVSDVADEIPHAAETADRILDGEAFTTEIQIGDRIFDTWNQPIFEDGVVDQAVIVAQDITDRRQQEKRFQTFLEGSSDIITVIDNNGAIEYVSPSIERILGYDPNELIGEPAFDHIHPDDREQLIVSFADLLAAEGGTTFVKRHRTRHADGSWRVTESRATTRSDIIQDMLVVNTRDVTDQVEAERSLRRMEQAIEASGHAIYITDTDGAIEYTNPAFERITGYSQEEVIGENPRFMNSGEMSDTHYEELWKTVKSGGVWEEEVINEHKNGQLYNAAQTIAPISTDTGDIEGFVAIQTDITDHKDRLKQLQVMDRILRHNLHNDMNVIRGYAETIQKRADDPFTKYATHIVQYSDHLLDLTDKQREITSVLSSEPILESYDAVVLIREIVETVSIEYPSANITLETPESAMVRATTGFDKALEELLRNAIVHTDQEIPEVDIQISENSTTTQVRIADRGPGIPEMERRVLMGEHEIEPLYHGSGLGLWLVSWIVRRCNGKLAFTEHDPRGMVAEITLHKPTSPPSGSGSDRGGD